MARQDTIDESGEGDPNSARGAHRPTLERQPTERDRLLDNVSTQREHLERNLSIEREVTLTTRASTSETYDNGLREQSSTLAQRDLIATVLDMKVDSHLEMQRMSQRIGRLEDLLTELVKRLSHDSSGVSTPADEVIPSITTTLVSTTAQTSTILVTPPPPPIPQIVATSSGSMPTVASTSGSSGSGLGPILLRKRRSKSRKAPAPPKTSPEQTRLLEAETPTATTSTTAAASTRKREFL